MGGQKWVRWGCGWVVAGVAGLALASPPTEKVVCTQAERSTWLSEAKIREVFGEASFTLVKLKVSHGNCYEFYAVHRDGSVVEAYYHPVTGEAVRYNRISMGSPVVQVQQSKASAPY